MAAAPVAAPAAMPAAVAAAAQARPSAGLVGALPEALALADSAASVREAASLLRERFAPLRVVVVDAFDMRDETPAASGQRRLLWGAASDGHCWQVTADLTQLAGLYLADRA